MQDPNEKSRIERLEEKLYSKQKKTDIKRSELRQKEYDVKREFFGSEKEKEKKKEKGNLSWEGGLSDSEKRQYLGSSPFLKLFIASILFFVLAGGAAAYFILSNANVVSTKKIEFDILAPPTIVGGEEFSLQVAITNRNEVSLLDPKVLLTLPEGARKPGSLEKIEKEVLQLSVIKPGETVQKGIPIVLFGNKHTEKEITAELLYTVEGSSNAVFKKEQIKIIEISSSPIELGVNIFRKSPSDQDIRLELVIDSNTTETIEDLILEAEYPPDFAFRAASPTPFADEIIWHLGSLKPGEQKKISITGYLTGVTTEEKIFRFQTGIQGDAEHGVGIPYSIANAETVIEAPFVLLDIIAQTSLNKEGFSAGSPVSSAVHWENNSGSLLANMEVVVEIDGDIVERASIVGNEGFYNSENDTIIWNTRTKAGFDVISSDENGDIPFSFKTLPSFSDKTRGMRNPEVDMNVTVRAERISEDGVSEILEAYKSKTVKMNTLTKLSARAEYIDSPFQNTGPIPPIVGKQTTYTIFWTLENSFNDVREAVVTAELPEYVKWGSAYTPQFEDLTFNEFTGVVTWHVGQLEAGAGITGAPRQIAFQVVLTPSLGQAGDSPLLISKTIFEGIDAFTGTKIKQLFDTLTTDMNKGGNIGEVTPE